MNSAWRLIACASLICAMLTACRARTEPSPQPARTHTRHVDQRCLARLDAAVESAISAGEIPGAVVVVGDRDGVLYRKAFGRRAIDQAEPMTLDTIFDLASLTKPVATASSIMKLVEQGRLRVTDRVVDYLPQFGSAGKDQITVEQLLLHTSGLIADNALADYLAGPARAWARICELSPQYPPGDRFVYSDVGYIVLGELIRAIAGRPLDEFARQEIFAALGMGESMFNPPAALHERIAPTENGIRGRVHDPRAAALGGVAGHAGLFATADDLSRFCRFLLQRPPPGALSSTTIQMYTQARPVPDGQLRTYGFDVDTGYSSPRGLRLSRGTSFGHTGFTGTSLWIDPVADLYIILLTSRLQMPDGGATQALRRAVATHAAEAKLGADRSRVLTGVDVLVQDGFDTLRGRRIGLITNHTGVDRFGRRTIDVLRTARDLDLAAIFSPEHGLAGRLDEEGIVHGRDEPSGLPIYSLYGETRRPTPQMLRDLDTLIFDIQDVGTRFYTYITTMGYAMEEAEKHGLRFIVLDRPNPIAPLGARGPLADEDKLSFIAYRPLPLVHGMTVGELAQFLQRAYMPRLDLQVVAMSHYRRGMWWEDTGVAWINPSPNMRSPDAAVLYPGIGLLEMTNLSVGRGTDTPFHWVGAPWIEGPALAAELASAGLQGVRFDAVRFTPAASKYAGQECQGARITITERAAYDPVRTGLTIALALRRLHGDLFESSQILKMLGNEAAYRAWSEADASSDLRGPVFEPSEQFHQHRRAALLY